MDRSLKIELHAHTKEDPNDFISYNAEELIDQMAEAGYDVLSITNHDVITYNDHLKNYAQTKGILLLPGVEATVEGIHVLLINITGYNEGSIKRLDDLLRFKKEDTLIIAPHPYYPSQSCIGAKLSKYINIFDAIEYCHCYIKHINPNLKAKKIAKEKNIPMIGTSDIHFRHQEGKTYSLIKSKKEVGPVINAIKNNKIEIVTKPLPYYEFFKIMANHTSISLMKFFRPRRTNGEEGCCHKKST